MDTSHQQWIEDNFGVQSFLFNEILNGEKTSVTFASVDMDKIVDYIDDAIPKLIECFQKNKENNKAWEKIFRQQGVVLTEPHPDMQAISQALHAGGANTILDLGCGSGRHVVYFAKQGFSVYGLDNSSTGLEIAKGWLSKENLKAELVNLEMTDKFPWKNSFFDAVISTAVIHHADTQIIKKIIAEVERVLKKGGLIFIQVPKQKNQAAKYKQIESNTFVPIDGPEAGLPHHYFTQEELKDYFSNFDIQDIHIDEWNHYCMTGRKH